MEIGGPKWKHGGLDTCLTLGGLALRLVPLLLVENCPFTAATHHNCFVRFKTIVCDGSQKTGQFEPSKERPTLQPISSKAIHMAGPRFFHLGPPISISKTGISKCVQSPLQYLTYGPQRTVGSRWRVLLFFPFFFFLKWMKISQVP